MAPLLPSRARLLSVGATLVAMALVTTGGLFLLGVLFPLVLHDGHDVSMAMLANVTKGLALTVVGYLGFRFVAARDLSPRSEEEASHSTSSESMLWPWYRPRPNARASTRLLDTDSRRCRALKAP